MTGSLRDDKSFQNPLDNKLNTAKTGLFEPTTGIEDDF